MSLHEQLELQKASFVARVPEEAQTAVFRHIFEQQQSGITFGLPAGSVAPDFSLTNPLGKTVRLHDELARTHIALVFYRGSWCPYCNVQLRAYEQILPDIQALGGHLMAISPQSPDNALTQKEKEQLSFEVLSDPYGRTADSYKLLFEMPNYLQRTFAEIFRLDLAAFNSADRWTLPVPATYLIDKRGIIRHASVNPDFMERMEPSALLDQLRNL
ncbi:peroxiredoxin [Paenibacillus phyllosphaerae]|uniref:thioredoxin-dependent peroxiredoxin n=1 Tax=Paenibacillus phyllosphaerae TaxID=274593 RepID=A0A7W5FPB1_9BACL|nr:peroxiredoxin-like family protein [Paenibacillus phyllosphaerae]MBB3111854.1 peroxiredoxin [Paenibacillus phyllosphaerae]